jgi:hypothetical protein
MDFQDYTPQTDNRTQKEREEGLVKKYRETIERNKRRGKRTTKILLSGKLIFMGLPFSWWYFGGLPTIPPQGLFGTVFVGLLSYAAFFFNAWLCALFYLAIAQLFGLLEPGAFDE